MKILQQIFTAFKNLKRWQQVLLVLAFIVIGMISEWEKQEKLALQNKALVPTVSQSSWTIQTGSTNTGDTEDKRIYIPADEIEHINKSQKIQEMSLEEKKKIFAEYIEAQRIAWEETVKLYPTKKQMENFREYTIYDIENRERHYREVAKRNGLLRDELTAIVVQANSEMWEISGK